MSKKVWGNFASAFLEYGIWSEGMTSELIALSVFDRSAQTVKSVSSGICSGMDVRIEDSGTKLGYRGFRYTSDGVGGTSFFAPLRIGKERVCHGLCLSSQIGKSIILTTRKRLYDDLYNHLMVNYELPLIKEWMPAIYQQLLKEKKISEGANVVTAYPDVEYFFPLGNESVSVRELVVVTVSLNETMLENLVSDMLGKKQICISPNPQQKLHFSNMDEYFSVYGSGVVNNLKAQLTPVSEHTDVMEWCALKGYSLYPQQISLCSGVANYFHKNKAKYAIFNCGMGTGKTIMGIVAVDAYYTRLAMERNHMTLAEVLKCPDMVNYRVIIMCPPHLVNKWVREVNSQIPYAKAEAITEFTQLVELKSRGPKRVGKEVYVISKDFGKLSYMDMPAVTQRKKKPIMECRCNECGSYKPLTYNGTECQNGRCNGKYVKVPSEINTDKVTGLICPSCGELLCIPPKSVNDKMKYALDVYDFKERNSTNDHCWFCGSSLWQPYVKNIGESTRQSKWHRMTHYANQSHKGKKTVWLMHGTEAKYFELVQQEPLNELGEEGGCRKYSPAAYIKKYLKGFFDFAIFDELHQYKALGSAQGNAMASLVKVSKRQLGLTGTIAGGYATHLFALLFRLEPKRMLDKGFNYNSETAFAQQYGTVEQRYAAVEGWRSNKMSKGRQLSSPKVKPGISPKVFTDFLMDRCVFLDLADMSSYLPPLKEQVVLVDTEPEIAQEYSRVVDALRTASHEPGGFGLSGSMLQFSLSYIDKPYGVGAIVNPKTGAVVVKPKNFSHMFSNGLTNKEKKLVELVNKELDESRNLVIFCEYTNSEETCITERLQSVIEENCGLYGQVQIIYSSHPAAIKREEWLHQKASEGIKVFITNPKILETGVDLCFEYNGVHYNYPTLVFFQTGYSLFTIWQASRRAYRLIQKEECRNYYIAAKDTLQPSVIKLIAAKQVATSAIQGRFSSEGLAAMAEGVDVRLELVKALAEKDTESVDELQSMFDVLAVQQDEKIEYKHMKTFYELIGENAPVIPEPEAPSMIDMASGILGGNSEENSIFLLDLFDLLDELKAVPAVDNSLQDKPQILSLFDFV